MTEPDTLHTRLRAEIERRLAVARAAEEWAPSPWKYQIVAPKKDAITSVRGDWVLTFAHHYEPVTHVVEFVTLFHPAAIIAWLEGELEVLERHTPHVGSRVCDRCSSDQHLAVYPCPEIRSLASRLGVSVDG